MTSPRERYRGITEAQFQTQMIELFRLSGWRVAHFRAARVGKRYMTPVGADGTGWPDLFAVHAPSGDRLAVELKREYHTRTTPEQHQWHEDLRAAGIECVVWKPSDIDTAIARIRKPRATG